MAHAVPLSSRIIESLLLFDFLKNAVVSPTAAFEGSSERKLCGLRRRAGRAAASLFRRLDDRLDQSLEVGNESLGVVADLLTDVVTASGRGQGGLGRGNRGNRQIGGQIGLRLGQNRTGLPRGGGDDGDDGGGGHRFGDGGFGAGDQGGRRGGRVLADLLGNHIGDRAGVIRVGGGELAQQSLQLAGIATRHRSIDSGGNGRALSGGQFSLGGDRRDCQSRSQRKRANPVSGPHDLPPSKIVPPRRMNAPKTAILRYHGWRFLHKRNSRKSR